MGGPDKLTPQNLYDTAQLRRVHKSIHALPETQTPLAKLALWSTSGRQRLDARAVPGFQVSAAISAASRPIQQPQRPPGRLDPGCGILACFGIRLFSQGGQNLALVRAGHQKEGVSRLV